MNKQDEEKVKELLNEVAYDKFGDRVILPDEPWYPVEFTSKQIRGAISDVALEMAKWKEQHMIEKTCKWLLENCYEYTSYPLFEGGDMSFIEDFKKAMMEE